MKGGGRNGECKQCGGGIKSGTGIRPATESQGSGQNFGACTPHSVRPKIGHRLAIINQMIPAPKHFRPKKNFPNWIKNHIAAPTDSCPPRLDETGGAMLGGFRAEGLFVFVGGDGEVVAFDEIHEEIEQHRVDFLQAAVNAHALADAAVD